MPAAAFCLVCEALFIEHSFTSYLLQAVCKIRILRMPSALHLLRLTPAGRFRANYLISHRSCSSQAHHPLHSALPPQTHAQLRAIAEALRLRPIVPDATAAKQPL
jgi:hypothetical protein